jgi:hypothetical protein
MSGKAAEKIESVELYSILEAFLKAAGIGGWAAFLFSFMGRAALFAWRCQQRGFSAAC